MVSSRCAGAESIKYKPVSMWDFLLSLINNGHLLSSLSKSVVLFSYTGIYVSFKDINLGNQGLSL